MWFKETQAFPFDIQCIKSSLIRIDQQSELILPCLYSKRPNAWVVICLGIYPPWEDMSSAFTWLSTPFPLSLANKSSFTRHHRSSDSPPPCGQHLDIASLVEKAIEGCHRKAALQVAPNPLYIGVITPMSDKSITHGIIAGIVKCPFCIWKTPKPVSCWSSTSSTYTTSWWSAVSTVFQAWYACWLGCTGIRANDSSCRYPSTSLSMVLRWNDVRMLHLWSVGLL